MVEDLVTDARLDAGRDYLEALRGLGLRLEGAFWSVRTDDPDSLELSLLSAAVDAVGTKRIYDVLFEAYDKAQTPKSFDPWQVSIYSPKMHFYKVVSDTPLDAETELFEVKIQSASSINGRPMRVDWQVERAVYMSWVYFLPDKRAPSRDVQLRSWKTFEKQVALAA